MNQNINMGTPMEGKKPTGIIVSIIVIVFILAFGAFYFFKQVPVPATSEPTTTSTNITETATPTDATVSALSTQGTSTEISDIQKDLNATDLSKVGAGVNDIAI